MKTLVLTLLVLAACDAKPEIARLDHSQILAVRTEPASVAPGERARIDVLAGDESGAVYEAVPDSVAARGLPVEHTAEGWFVTAGGPEIATLEVAIDIDGTEWRATKSLVVSERTENPRIATMQIDGAASEQLVAAVGTKPALSVTAEGDLDYAWYSSVGDLELYRQPSAILDAKEPAVGHVVIVVRDATGGVSWKLLPARVE